MGKHGATRCQYFLGSPIALSAKQTNQRGDEICPKLTCAIDKLYKTTKHLPRMTEIENKVNCEHSTKRHYETKPTFTCRLCQFRSTIARLAMGRCENGVIATSDVRLGKDEELKQNGRAERGTYINEHWARLWNCEPWCAKIVVHQL
jgi:hypothetical protein